MTVAPTDEVRVLHVDDDPDLVDLVGEYLEAIDARLSVASETDPEEAVDTFHRDQFDAVVGDYEMPRLNGLDLLDVVRASDADLPFVLFTGRGSEEIASEAITRGVTEYMQKGTGTDQYSVLANRIVNAVHRYRAERTASAERDRFRAVFERAFDAMLVADDEGRYLDVNPAAAVLFDRSERALLGRTAADLAVADFDFETAWETVRSAEPERGLFPIQRPDGEVRIAEYAASTDVQPGEHLTELRDVTEQRKAEERVQLERERLGEFAGVLSHDLKNPVAIARARLKLALEEATSPEQVETLVSAESAVVRIERVIDDVLAISSSGRLVSDPTEVALSEVADRVWDRVRRGSARATIEDGIAVRADESHLERLLTNLFRNAIEHAGTDVTLAVGRLTDPAGFYVEDDGPGIPHDARDVVFDRRHTTKPGGTGIGLGSVRQVVETEGWAIAIVDGRTGGARVEITGVDVTA